MGRPTATEVLARFPDDPLEDYSRDSLTGLHDRGGRTLAKLISGGHVNLFVTGRQLVAADPIPGPGD